MEVSEKLLKTMVSVVWVNHGKNYKGEDYYEIVTEYDYIDITKEEYDEFKKLEEMFE